MGDKILNIFVLSTGRCGSTTFAKACAHIVNYSSAHESLARRLGADRLAYPDNHIESDNRLSWLLGRLDRAYGDAAFYVHLKRDDEQTVESFVKRYSEGIVAAYRSAILMGPEFDDDPRKVSLDYVRTVNANIEFFLKDKTNKMNFRLENAETDFADFWKRIGAAGDYESALAEFRTSHNATKIQKPVIQRVFDRVRKVLDLPK